MAEQQQQQEQPRPTLGACAACGMAVVIESGRIVRACAHDKAAVQVGMTATLEGRAHVAG